jgi:hypothetical protein
MPYTFRIPPQEILVTLLQASNIVLYDQQLDFLARCFAHQNACWTDARHKGKTMALAILASVVLCAENAEVYSLHKCNKQAAEFQMTVARTLASMDRTVELFKLTSCTSLYQIEKSMPAETKSTPIPRVMVIDEPQYTSTIKSSQQSDKNSPFDPDELLSRFHGIFFVEHRARLFDSVPTLTIDAEARMMLAKVYHNVVFTL